MLAEILNTGRGRSHRHRHRHRHCLLPLFFCKVVQRLSFDMMASTAIDPVVLQDSPVLTPLLSSASSTPTTISDSDGSPPNFYRYPFQKDVNFKVSGDSPAYKSLAVLSGHDGAVSCLALCGEFFLTASRGKDIIVWQHPDLRQFAKFGQGKGSVKAFVTCGNRVFTAHQDGRIRVWRVTRDSQNVFKLVNTLPTAKDYFGKLLNKSNYVQTRRHHKRLWIEHADSISCLEVSVSDNLIYSGSWDKTLKVWRMSDFKCLESINAHDDAINCLVARNGIVYSASSDGKIKAWGKEKSNKTHHVLKGILEGYRDVSLNSLVVSEDGSFVYGGGSNGHVIGWEANEEFASWKRICDVRAHTMSVLCMHLMGDLLCIGSADKSISIWKRGGDGKMVVKHMVITGHEGPVRCLQASSLMGIGCGFMLYSGSLDKTVRVWWIPKDSNNKAEQRGIMMSL